MVTPAGEEFLAGFGIDVHQLAHGRRAFCRPCLDWSERRTHLAGSLGRALLARFEAEGWRVRKDGGISGPL